MPGPAATFDPLLRGRAIVRVFGLTVLGFASAFTIVADLGPIINRLTGVTGAGVGALQAFIDVGSFLGLAVNGIFADRKVVRLGSIAAFALMAFDLGAYSWTLSIPPKGGRAARRRWPDACTCVDHVGRRSHESRSTRTTGRTGNAIAGAQRIASFAWPGPWCRLGWRDQRLCRFGMVGMRWRDIGVLRRRPGVQDPGKCPANS